MPIDPSILLQSQPVQVPNPMDLAGKALTLGNLSNTNQMGNIQVQQAMQQMRMMQDPRFASSLQYAIGGPSGATGGPGGAPPDFAGLMQDFPNAGMAPYENLLKLGKEAASMRKDNADAQLAGANEFVKRSGLLGNFAAAVARDPNDMNYGRALNQVGMIPNGRQYFQPPPMDASPQERVQWAAGVANTVTDPQKQQQMMVELGKFSPEMAKLAAEARLAGTNADLAGPKFGLDLQKFGLEQDKYAQGPVVTDANGKQWRLAGGPGGTMTAVPVPVSQPPAGGYPMGTTGAGQTGVSPGTQAFNNMQGATPAQQAAVAVDFARNGGTPAASPQFAPGLGVAGDAQKQGLVSIVKDASNDRSIAQQILTTLPSLENIARNMYSGGVLGTEGAKKVMTIASAIPGLSALVDQDKLANAKTFDTIVSELYGGLMKQISQRGSNFIAKLVVGVKPGTDNTPEAIQGRIGAIKTGAQNLYDYSNGVSKYLNENPNARDLSGYNFSPATFQPQGQAAPQGKFSAVAPNGKAYPFPDEASMRAAQFEWQKIGQ